MKISNEKIIPVSLLFISFILAGCPLLEPDWDEIGHSGGARTPDFSQNATIIELVNSCRANSNTVCLPDQHWRCTNYDVPTKDCMQLVGFIHDGEQPIELCNELSKGDLVTYCLSKNNLTMCYDYAGENDNYKKICSLQECLQEAYAGSGDKYNCFDEYRGFGASGEAG